MLNCSAPEAPSSTARPHGSHAPFLGKAGSVVSGGGGGRERDLGGRRAHSRTSLFYGLRPRRRLPPPTVRLPKQAAARLRVFPTSRRLTNELGNRSHVVPIPGTSRSVPFPRPPLWRGGGERKSVSSRHEPHSYFKTKNDTPFAKDPPPPALLPGWLARPASGSFHPEARTGFQREPRAAPRGWQLFGLGPGEGPDGFYHHHPPQAKMPRLLDEVRSSNGGADPFSRCKVLSIRFQRCRLTNVFCFLKQKSYGVLLIYEKRENNHLLTIRHWQCAIRICS